MKNLLAETIEAIISAENRIDTVVAVRSRDGRFATTWAEFAEIADVLYDSGYGAQHVSSDLIVEFQDGTYLYREEYDGSEWWSHNKPLPAVAQDALPITQIFGEYWPTVESAHRSTLPSSDQCTDCEGSCRVCETERHQG